MPRATLLLALHVPARIAYLGCYTDDAEDRHLKHGPEECGCPALLSWTAQREGANTV